MVIVRSKPHRRLTRDAFAAKSRGNAFLIEQAADKAEIEIAILPNAAAIDYLLKIYIHDGILGDRRTKPLGGF